jgi:hypothetical protein
MAIVRCEIHPVKLAQATNKYAKRVKPLGYPVTAAICGTKNCIKPGLIWLTEEELSEYNRGERYFRVKTYTVKVRASDDTLPLP